jgi:hypothetical protein
MIPQRYVEPNLLFVPTSSRRYRNELKYTKMLVASGLKYTIQKFGPEKVNKSSLRRWHKTNHGWARNMIK